MFFVFTSDGDKATYLVTPNGRYHVPSPKHWDAASKISRGEKPTQAELLLWDEIFKAENKTVVYG